MRKKFWGITIAVVSGMLLFGCDGSASTGKTETEPEQTETGQVIGEFQDVAGVELGNETVELVLESDQSGVSLTEDTLITNTKKINVSISGLQSNEEAIVYLYWNENMEDYIAAATLSAEKDSFEFSGLTVIRGYRVGVEVKNLAEDKILKITD